MLIFIVFIVCRLDEKETPQVRELCREIIKCMDNKGLVEARSVLIFALARRDSFLRDLRYARRKRRLQQRVEQIHKNHVVLSDLVGGLVLVFIELFCMERANCF